MGELIKVATLAEVPPGTGRQVDVSGRIIALFNVKGTIYAIGGSCTHRGGPLGEGDLDGTVVTCPLHAAQFDVTTGQVLAPPAPENVACYRVVLEGDAIKVEIP